MRSEPDASEDEATRAARIARARAHWRKRQWLSDTMTLRAVQFPIYGAEGWPGQLGGVGSRDDQIISIKIHHYETPDADMWAGGRPRLAITTRRGELRPGEALSEARQALESVIRQDAGAGQTHPTTRSRSGSKPATVSVALRFSTHASLRSSSRSTASPRAR
jgi:hypothetical protein